MKILIDINHPGNVHYFKHFIKIMRHKRHEILLTARNSKIICQLLEAYDFDYIPRGKGGDSISGKIFKMISADYKIYKHARSFKPDLLMSFSSPYAAQVAALLRKPHINLNDTEHSDRIHRKFTYPFSKYIITPSTYQNNLGKKHIRINTVVEYAYLNPKVFKPNPDIFQYLGISKEDKYVVIRFVSWQALHDINQGGLSLEMKHKIIKLLEKKYRVFICAEKGVDSIFKPYQLKIPPEKMHDALAYASLFISEGGTSASESALLATPTIYINSLPLMCYLKLAQQHGVIEHFNTEKEVMSYVQNFLDKPPGEDEMIMKRNAMTKDFINLTDYLIWFVENYPESGHIATENPEKLPEFHKNFSDNL